MGKQYHGTCRHCRKRKVARPRGLCWNCWSIPGVREKYPAQVKPGPQTDAELEASIAAQLGTMPPANQIKTPRLI